MVPDNVAQPDPAATTLAEAAVSVSDSLHQLAAVKRAATPAKKRMVSDLRYELPGKASLDWSGPIQPLLAQIAQISHYRLRVLGTPPAVPIIISVTANNTPLTDLLRDIDFQAASQASVRVYHQKHGHIIELRYATA